MKNEQLADKDKVCRGKKEGEQGGKRTQRKENILERKRNGMTIKSGGPRKEEDQGNEEEAMASMPLPHALSFVHE